MLVGTEDKVSNKKDWSVQGHLRLCNESIQDWRPTVFLQRVYTQCTRHHTIRWHWFSCVWGECIFNLSFNLETLNFDSILNNKICVLILVLPLHQNVVCAFCRQRGDLALIFICLALYRNWGEFPLIPSDAYLCALLNFYSAFASLFVLLLCICNQIATSTSANVLFPYYLTVHHIETVLKVFINAIKY